MKRRILQVGQKGKLRDAKRREISSLKEYEALDLDSKAALIEELIPLGLMHVNEILQQEVRDLAGAKYQRDGLPGYDRWGKQWGSVYLGEQRISLKVPRVRDTVKGREVALRGYERLQAPGPKVGDGALLRVLRGISCRNYRECSEAIPEAFSLSSSTISRRVIASSQKRLRTLLERRLEKYDFVALILDGKRFGDDGIILALGITTKGEKIVLGITQSAAENHVVGQDFLESLIERGLNFREGLLFVIDGSKGIRKAISNVFGVSGVVQRCQWHKRENIIKYLPGKLQEEYRRKLQKAYEMDNYEDAKKALLSIRQELVRINESAARSFDEGFEETLTVQKLGLSSKLRRSLKTSNCIESVFSQVGAITDKVDNWKSSSQKQRWTASALLLIEPRLNKISGYRQMASLREALKKKIAEDKKSEAVKSSGYVERERKLVNA